VLLEYITDKAFTYWGGICCKDGVGQYVVYDGSAMVGTVSNEYVVVCWVCKCVIEYECLG